MRHAGILMPIFSLPGEYGIGCLGTAAYNFVDWLKKAGQTYWQILPIHPTFRECDPYHSFSVFAGDPYLIDLEDLIREGVLTREECDCMDFGDYENEINYGQQYESRNILLTMAYERSQIQENPEFHRFVKENGWWLRDYALFMALKNYFGGQCWHEWEEDIRLYKAPALEYYHRELYYDVEFQMYLQFTFFRQYWKLKHYANENGIKLIGDITVDISLDCADVWAHQELFHLKEEKKTMAVTGYPIDRLGSAGPASGSPLYRWDRHCETRYAWWMERLQYGFRLYDLPRLCRFQEYHEFVAVPYEKESPIAVCGDKNHGVELFRHMEEKLGRQKLIVEGLGDVTDAVHSLIRSNGFYGVKVLEFAFDVRDLCYTNPHLPHNYSNDWVVYPSTCDNETVVGWLDTIPTAERSMLRRYLSDYDTPEERLHESVIALAMSSVARICIVSIQDWLGLDNSCRMHPAPVSDRHWCWRFTEAQLNQELCAEIFDMTLRYGRMNWNNTEIDTSVNQCPRIKVSL